MKIVAIVGSPRKKGNCATLVKAVCDAAKTKKHTSKTYFLYEQKIKGCIACDACTDRKVPICVHKDDFNKIAKEMIKADCLILSSPIYMGHITGPMKTFIDRWYTFAEEDFSIRHIMGKKFVVITTSGAEDEAFKYVSEYLNKWIGKGFFKLKSAGTIVAGGLSDPGDVSNRKQLLKEAEKIGKNL